MSHMTPSEHQAIGEYARTIFDLLGLKDWHIRIEGHAALDPSCSATVEVTYGRRLARIAIGETWQRDSAAEFRDTIVHEALHVHQWNMFEIIDTLEPYHGQATWDVFQASLKLAEENQIDSITRAIACAFPLPTIAKNAKRIARKMARNLT
jgi:hypothetical protein